MNMQNNFTIQDDELASRIQSLVAQLRADSNPEQLDKIKKLVRKNVPFSLRGYFSAYLLRELIRSQEQKNARSSFTRPSKPERQERAEKSERADSAERSEKKAPAQKPETREHRTRQIPEGAKTLYINLGKIGHVYARDLVSLLTADELVSKDDIYLIRLHDKYSFVTMSEANCEKAIAKLQGQTYRNRVIQINYSNKEKKASDDNDPGQD